MRRVLGRSKGIHNHVAFRLSMSDDRSLLGSYLLPVGTLLGSGPVATLDGRAEAKTRRGGLMPGPLSARRVS